MDATREALAVAWHAPTDSPRRVRSGRAGWRRGPQYRGNRVTPAEGRGLSSRAAHDGGRDVGTGENLTASERVQRLQRALHAKAKEAPDFRFYSLCDKVWRADVLAVAWQAVRRNGGAAGVDGETVADVESLGVDQWLGALARDLKEGTYRPRPVRWSRSFGPFEGFVKVYSGCEPRPRRLSGI